MKTYLDIKSRRNEYKTTVGFLKDALRKNTDPEIYVLWKKYCEASNQQKELWINEVLEVQSIRQYSRLFMAIQHDSELMCIG